MNAWHRFEKIYPFDAVFVEQRCLIRSFSVPFWKRKVIKESGLSQIHRFPVLTRLRTMTRNQMSLPETFLVALEAKLLFVLYC